MIELYEQGRTEMMPDTTSFNTVVDALSKSREEKTERRAEKLLERMQVLSTKNDSLKLNCSPDQVVSSFVPHDDVTNWFQRLIILYAVLQHSLELLGTEPSKRRSTSCDCHPGAYGTKVCNE